MSDIAILGLGLIGGSLARALAQHGGYHITAYDLNEVSLAYALKEGMIQRACTDAAEAVAGADVVMLAAPPAALGELAQRIAPALKPGAILTDAASVKQAAIAAIAPHLPPHATYVPGHPIAGSEQSGVHAAKADLFRQRRVLLTPLSDTPPAAIQRIAELWSAAGATVETLPPDAHDLIYAYVSHLPQLLAFAVADSSVRGTNQGATDAFSRFTRLASSNRALWAEIFAANRANLCDARAHYLALLEAFIQELSLAPASDAPADAGLVAIRLFPRIASTCLAATVMQIAATTGLHMARYGGSGFADFIAPSESAPEADMELISTHSHAVLAALIAFRESVAAFQI